MQAYDRSAALYDAIYAGKSYGDEVAALRAIIAERCPHARTLLDVGCGTGGHLIPLSQHFTVEGLDHSAGMLEAARTKLPAIPLHHADMCRFALGRTFDVVTSLFSAIGYALDYDQFAAAISAMASHVAPGGLLAIEPWFTPDQWRPRSKAWGELAIDRDDLKIARLGISDQDGRLAVMRMHHVVVTPTTLDSFEERHEMYLAEPSEYLRAFAAAALADVRYVPAILVRGLWIASRPSPAG